MIEKSFTLLLSLVLALLAAENRFPLFGAML